MMIELYNLRTTIMEDIADSLLMFFGFIILAIFEWCCSTSEKYQIAPVRQGLHENKIKSFELLLYTCCN
jgi:hypothetical protein